MSVDRSRLEVGASPAIPLAENLTIRHDGNTDGGGGFDGFARLYLSARVNQFRRKVAGAAVTFQIEGSADGMSGWAPLGDPFAFTAPGVQEFEIDDPAAFIRVSWVVDEGVDLCRVSLIRATPGSLDEQEGPGGGSEPITGAGPPTQGGNTIWDLGPTSAPLGSGTFRLSFQSVETADLPYDSPLADIANAMNTAYGATVVIPYPGSEASTIIDFSQSLLFVGSLGAQDVATPTVTHDTTDTGVTATADTPGFAADPVGTPGQLYIDTDNGAVYQYGLPSAAASTAVVWYPASPADRLVSPDGLSVVTLSGNNIVMSDIHGNGTWAWTIQGDDGNSIGIIALDSHLTLTHSDPSTRVAEITLQNGYVLLPNLPTDPTGLPSGAIYNDGGALKVA